MMDRNDEALPANSVVADQFSRPANGPDERRPDLRHNFLQLAAKAESVSLLGACVSLDTRDTFFPKVRKFRYLLRIGTMSLMSPAPSRIDMSKHIPNEKELLTFERDANKTFDFDAFLSERFALIDFFRDTYSVLELEDGRYITAGLQYGTFKLKPHLPIRRIIDPLTPEYPDLWLESFRRFAERANASPPLWIIAPIYQFPYQRTGWDNVIPRLPGASGINRRNVVLAHMQRIALALLRHSCMLPIAQDQIELDPEHKFGPGPYHFRRSYFTTIRDMIQLNPGYLRTFDGDEAAREKAVEYEMTAWHRRAATF